MSKNKAMLITPPGAGGVAVIFVIGNNICELIAPFFGKQKSLQQNNRIYYGNLYNCTNEIIDQVLLRYFSYKNETAIEICCHGGTAIINAIFSLLSDLKIAKTNANDLYKHNIVLQHFISSKTELAAKIFCYQLNGAWNEFRYKITTYIRQKQLTEAQVLVKETLETYSLFHSITSPKSIVIAGKPNSGKSTLMNQLVGRERVIVDPTPGTTRDAIKVLIAINGVPFYLYDTAGIRTSSNEIENMGIAKTLSTLSSSDYILWVIDASLPPTTEDIPKGATVLLNKIDVTNDFIEKLQNKYPKALCISAKNSQGLENIGDFLVPDIARKNKPFAMVASKEQYDVLQEIQQYLCTGYFEKVELAMASMCFDVGWEGVY